VPCVVGAVDRGGTGRPEPFDDIGERLRGERHRRGVSQRELARRVGMSASLISQIELGRSKPSVGTLYAIVSELGVSLDRLFHGHEDVDVGQGGMRAEGSGSVLVRPDERDVIELESGVRWERLTSGDEGGVDFLFVVYDVGGASTTDGSMIRHPGREYGYVMSGRLGLQIGFTRHEVGAGDSVAFDSTQPHRLWNLGDVPVHGLWTVVGRAG
jgi:transcriptional regulator with XRE-family HTH domain